MVSHYIIGVYMTRELRSDEKICQYCGKIFRYKKGPGRKPDYCKTCRKNGNANKSKCNKWYYNQGWIIKQNYETPSEINYKASLKIIDERKINYNNIPLQFNQVDPPDKLGNTWIGTSPVKNEDGEIDWEHELNIIRNEKRRLEKNYTYNTY